MKVAQTLSVIAAITIAFTMSPAFAANKTVTLSIPTMDCEVCPITVKKALNKVKGVGRIDVNPEKRIVVATFDDAQTNAAALTETTRNAGYPSKVVETRQ